MQDMRAADQVRERVLELYQKGLTRGEIAREVGKTRNSIIGILWRMGIRDDPARAFRAAVKRTKRVRAMRKKIILKPHPTRSLPPEPDPSIKTNEAYDLANPSPDRQTILVKDGKGQLHANNELTESCCRWPVGDPQTPEFHFCGREKVPHLPYCIVHSHRAFRAPEQSQKTVAFAPPKILEPTP